jgi:dephospho-CoA kinase
MKIAITGGIGAGKSYVCQRLRARGIAVYDCDSAAKRLMAESQAIREGLISLVGPDVYSQGQLRKDVLTEFLLQSEANKQAQILVGQENITDKARQRARAILDKAQARADHLTNGADEYCTTVMTGLQEQLGKLSHDVQAGLNVLEERQRAAGEQMPHLNINDYPEAQ